MITTNSNRIEAVDNNITILLCKMSKSLMYCQEKVNFL